MGHMHTRNADVFKATKHGISLKVYPDIGDCGVVNVDTDTGHNEEFYHKVSTFHYVILDGSGSFFLDDMEVKVEKGDLLSIEPMTRIYYKGKMRLLLITHPAWREEDEVETKPSVW